MDEVKAYRNEKLVMLEEDFHIELNADDYMKLIRAKSEIEIDNHMRTIFQKYL